MLLLTEWPTTSEQTLMNIVLSLGVRSGEDFSSRGEALDSKTNPLKPRCRATENVFFLYVFQLLLNCTIFQWHILSSWQSTLTSLLLSDDHFFKWLFHIFNTIITTSSVQWPECWSISYFTQGETPPVHCIMLNWWDGLPFFSNLSFLSM